MFWKGLDISQYLDLSITIAPRLRHNNAFANTGRSSHSHHFSAAQQHPSNASIWPIVRRVKSYGHRKENNFQLCCLVEAQIIYKQAKLTLIEKQMSNSFSGLTGFIIQIFTGGSLLGTWSVPKLTNDELKSCLFSASPWQVFPPLHYNPHDNAT